MGTTTIRLEDELKARVSAAAERAGTTTHAFILEAIERTVDQVEVEEEFQRLAGQRWVTLIDSGKTVPFDELRTYAVDRAAGKTPPKPRARTLKR